MKQLRLSKNRKLLFNRIWVRTKGTRFDTSIAPSHDTSPWIKPGNYCTSIQLPSIDGETSLEYPGSDIGNIWNL